MPPPENPLPLPRPRPRPKPPKPKPKPPKPEPEMMPRPVPVRDEAHDVVPFPPDPSACASDCSESCARYRLCPPPPPSSSSAATVHLRSSRLPTPLIALSASVLAVSVVLLLVLLVCHVVRRRRRQTAPQETPLTAHHVGEEGGAVLTVAAEEDADGDDGSGVHHVWYIRTVGLDERAIAAITALVYDAEKCGRVGGDDDGGGCAVCLAEFRDGETLRLLPRCRHAFHRGCIDTWLRAHVNCPLCRAPVKVADQAASGNAAPSAATAALGGDPAASLGAAGSAGAEEASRDGAIPERAVRRAASMVALPRLPWPDLSLRAPASNSGREGEMGVAKITRLMKISEALEMAGLGVGRSVSFGSASCLRLSGQSATGVNADELSR